MLLLMMLITSFCYAKPINYALGVYAGPNFPVVQDNAKSGYLLGAKLRIASNSLPIALEPYITLFPYNDKDVIIQGNETTQDGGQLSSLGINSIFGVGNAFNILGVHYYTTLGIGYYKYSREHTNDIEKFGYNFGIGGEYVFSNLSLDINGKFHIVAENQETSRSLKNFGVYTGVNYYLPF